MADGDTVVKRTIDHVDGSTETIKEYGDAKVKSSIVDKAASAGSGVSVLTVAALVATVTLTPAILPYALAEHSHDQAPMIQAIVVSIDKTILKGRIEQETTRINDLHAQILSGLCIPTSDPSRTCVLENTFKDQAQARLLRYQSELNNIE